MSWFSSAPPGKCCGRTNQVRFRPHTFRSITRNYFLICLRIKHAAENATLNSPRMKSKGCKMSHRKTSAAQYLHCSSFGFFTSPVRAVYIFIQTSRTCRVSAFVNVKPLRCSSFLPLLLHWRAKYVIRITQHRKTSFISWNDLTHRRARPAICSPQPFCGSSL